MRIQTHLYTVPSADGVHTLAGIVYCPPGNPRGILHVVHGMTEYIGRYDRFMREMAEAGWMVCGFDNLGHGQTADPSELGFIAHEKGWDILCEDVKAFGESVRRRYSPMFGLLPYVLMGHSMGSFIARQVAARYALPDGLIIMGTGGPNPLAGVGVALTGIIKTFRGDKYVSKLIYSLVFGGYTKPFRDEEDIYAWLTTDRAVRDVYRKDPLCTFPFTVSAMGDLIRLTHYVNKESWFRVISSKLPILLVSGADDPVGGMGKGVKAVYRNLVREGKQVSYHLYEGARHEILNDTCHDDVVRDIRAFLDTYPEIPDYQKETL